MQVKMNDICVKKFYLKNWRISSFWLNEKYFKTLNGHHLSIINLKTVSPVTGQEFMAWSFWQSIIPHKQSETYSQKSKKSLVQSSVIWIISHFAILSPSSFCVSLCPASPSILSNFFHNILPLPPAPPSLLPKSLSRFSSGGQSHPLVPNCLFLNSLQVSPLYTHPSLLASTLVFCFLSRRSSGSCRAPKCILSFRGIT